MEYQESTDLLYPVEVDVYSGVTHPSTPDPWPSPSGESGGGSGAPVPSESVQTLAGTLTVIGQLPAGTRPLSRTRLR